MSSTRLIQWSGLTCLGAGILYALGALLHPTGETIEAIMNSNWVPSHLVYWVSVVLLHFSLVGMYAVLAKDSLTHTFGTKHPLRKSSRRVG